MILNDLTRNNYKYDFDQVISKIKTDRAKGLDICLFVGRTPDQPVPNEPEKNRVWYTIDAEPRVTERTSLRKNNEVDDEHHILMDLNDRQKIKKLKNLFTFLFVDGCVQKGITYVWKSLIPLLEKKPSSELTLSANYINTSFNGLDKTTIIDIQKALIRYSEEDFDKAHAWQNQANEENNEGISLDQEEQTNSNSSLIEDEQCSRDAFDYLKDEFLKQTEDFLKTRFRHVHLVKGKLPYDKFMTFKYDNYWHLKEPIDFVEKFDSDDDLILNTCNCNLF